jgi:Aromatic-ring-opening dioxygenase LigAB, LigA subunit
LAEDFRRDAEKVMARCQIDELERDLLKCREIRELYDRGVNPLLLLLAHGPVTGQTMLEYMTAMNRILK